MAIIDTASFLYRAGNYSGAGNWLDEIGTKDLTPNGTIGFTPQTATDLAFFTFNSSDDFFRNIDAADEMKPGAGDYTLIYVARAADPAANGIGGIDTQDAFGTASGIQLRETGPGNVLAVFADGATQYADQGHTMIGNTIHELAMRVDRTAEELEAFLDGTGTGSPADLTGAGSALGGDFDVGRVLTTYLGNCDIFALAIWVGTALSDADIATAGDELTTSPTPANPTATAVSSSQIDTTWDDVAGETGYRVERSDDGVGGWVDVSGALPADSTSYSDTGLDPSTEYFYRVIAVTNGGESPPSSVVSATTDAPPEDSGCGCDFNCMTTNPLLTRCLSGSFA